VRILVIGGAGYIGSHVVKELLDTGHEVGVFDNLSTGRKENLFPHAEFHKGDILDSPLLQEVLSRGWEAVVHLAALKAAGESMKSPEIYAENNICGTINLLNAMTEAAVSIIIFSSSAAVYGAPQYLPIDEKHPTEPLNFYGFTKLEIERILHWYSRLRKLNFASLRYFNAAGYDPEGKVRGLEQNPANLLPVVMETAAGMRQKMQIFGTDYSTADGTCIRDYIHVSDLASAHRLALEHIRDKEENLTVNLGTGRGISVAEIIDIARKVSGKAIPAEAVGRRAGDPPELVASSDAARSLLNWKPRCSDAESLVSTSWDVYKERQ
jgi:UDP-glucose 4-epimerase